MSVKIFYSKKIATYDPDKPLQHQLKGCKKVVIEYEPKDSSIDRFIDEIEQLCDKNNSTVLNINLVHNDFIAGAKLKKRVKKLETNTSVNTLIKMMASGYSETDKKLEQIASICTEGDCNGKEKA